KENTPDIRNSRVIDIIMYLKEYGINSTVVDPVADKFEAKREYGIDIVNYEEVTDADCIVFAVGHEVFKQMTLSEIDHLFKEMPNQEKVIIDIKGILNKSKAEKENYSFWRL